LSDSSIGGNGVAFIPDRLDLQILEYLSRDAGISYKDMAKAIGMDQRTVAKRIAIMKATGLIRTTIDIDWPRIGIHANAFVGSSTAMGDRSAARLYEFIRGDPRIVEAYSTVGAHQYFLKVLESDLQRLRDEVLRDVEPLTAELSTSVISSEVKQKDFAPFLKFVRQNRLKLLQE
jgi:DNA-binding Lrp family transcriptional regulator